MAGLTKVCLTCRALQVIGLLTPCAVIAPSAVKFSDDYPLPKAMTADDLDRVSDAFVASVERCKQIGCTYLLSITHSYLCTLWWHRRLHRIAWRSWVPLPRVPVAGFQLPDGRERRFARESDALASQGHQPHPGNLGRPLVHPHQRDRLGRGPRTR